MPSELLKLHKTEENDLLIREFLLYLKSDKGCRPNTIIAYQKDLDEFRGCFINQNLLHLKERDIRQYKYWLVDRNLSPRTVNRKLAVIRSFFSYFANSDEWDILRNPVKNIPSMKLKKTPPIILNESQAETLLDGILLTGLFALRDLAIFSTFLFTGLRVSEIVKLKISDIDFDNLLLHVVDGKGGKSRSIPIIPRLESVLSMYLSTGTVYKTTTVKLKTKTKEVSKIDRAKCGRDFFIVPGVENNNTLFLTRNGTAFSERGIGYLFKSYTKRLGIYKEKLSLHAMRRSCLTFLYKKGVDLFVLKEISGHAKVQTLEHYIHIDKTKVFAALNKHPLARGGMDMRLVDLVRNK